MSPTQTTRSQKARFALIAIAAVLMAAAPVPARAQAFADLKSRAGGLLESGHGAAQDLRGVGQVQVEGHRADARPSMVPADAAAPAHCRVTGLLAPEIAFEVSLPAKWNGRFYMIGNGGHAGEALDDAGRVAQRNAALAARLRLRADQHRP